MGVQAHQDHRDATGGSHRLEHLPLVGRLRRSVVAVWSWAADVPPGGRPPRRQRHTVLGRDNCGVCKESRSGMP